MYIKSLEIKNFRNFHNFKIDFTDEFQTIIGENNIGKSNLYWAIRLVLDKDISYNSRKLEPKDFYDFKELDINAYILISIEFYDNNLSSKPSFHAIKTSENTACISYIYAHKSKFSTIYLESENIDIKDFEWRLYGGGENISIEDVEKLNNISFKDLEGINVYYISGFRNINSELFGSSKSLLTEYCKSRPDSNIELSKVQEELINASDKLNKLDFMPNLTEKIQTKNKEITGPHFNFPIGLGFIHKGDSEVWNELKLFFNPRPDKNLPLHILGLGQKNLLYLSLFLSKLKNEECSDEVNIVLVEEPEAHLHPQLQKILFSNLSQLTNTQVFMSSHSTHIASNCNNKNLNVIYKANDGLIKSFSPFNLDLNVGVDNKIKREIELLKRYLDATRSELFFSSAVIFVEGVAEQFIIPAIADIKYGVKLVEHNVSVVPIHSRYFDPFLRLFQKGKLELTACAIIDGDADECLDEEETRAVTNAKELEVEERVGVFVGTETLEIDLFPNKETNKEFLKICFENLGHKRSYNNLMNSTEGWSSALIKRIDKTVTKGRFAQELALNISQEFEVPRYIEEALTFIFKQRKIDYKNGAK